MHYSEQEIREIINQISESVRKEKEQAMNNEEKKQIIRVYRTTGYRVGPSRTDEYIIESEEQMKWFLNGLELMMIINGEDPEDLLVEDNRIVNNYSGELYAELEHYVQKA